MNNITTETIRDEFFEDHFIRVDELTELNMDGNIDSIKNVCWVIRPDGESRIFNVSPYTHADLIMGYAIEWILLGCPENKDEFGIPQKWDADSLRDLRPLSGKEAK